MGIVEDLRGFFGGGGSAPSGIDKIEQFCFQNCWTVDRVGGGLVASFSTPAGIRRALISVGNAGEMGAIQVASAVEFTPADIPDSFPALLLVRSQKLPIGGWVATDGGRKVGFAVRDIIFVSALTAALLKWICNTMVNEVAEIDQAMARSGY